MELDEITAIIVDSSLRIHRELGPGLLESVDEAVLANALAHRGLTVRRQHLIAFCFDGMSFDEGFRAGLLVEERVIVELKSVERLGRVHLKQLLTYLRLADLRVGLLVNFGAPTLKEGLHRVVNRFPRSQSRRLPGRSLS